VHSISLLVYSSVGGHKFALSLRDIGATRSLVKLCTIPTASQWTLIPLPNLPVWDSGGGWSINPGAVGYTLSVVLACGTTYIAPATDIWQTGQFLGAPGMTNFGAAPLNSAFYLGFVQHEPGPVCSTLIDCPFSQNLPDCLRYYQKSYPYNVIGGGSSAPATITGTFIGGTAIYPTVSFPTELAKTPTMRIWRGGALNTVLMAGLGNAAITGPPTADPKRIGSQLTLSASSTAGIYCPVIYDWDADTGW
jgi:hypothetical protein